MRFYKLNVDGSAKAHGEDARGGCIVRSWTGELLAASSHKCGNHTVLYAELRAFLDGLKLCCKLRLLNVVIEVDCMEVIKLISYS